MEGKKILAVNFCIKISSQRSYCTKNISCKVLFPMLVKSSYFVEHVILILWLVVFLTKIILES